MAADETIEELLERVKALPEREPAQTSLHKTVPVYMPPKAETCTHVYTKRAKQTPLGPRNDGPWEILERRGKSCLLLKMGDYVSGKPRTELRHWNSCSPADMEADTKVAEKPKLGRKKSKPQERIHTGEKPQNQAKHKRIHTGEKPLNPDAKEFKPHYNLRKYSNIHTVVTH